MKKLALFGRYDDSAKCSIHLFHPVFFIYFFLAISSAYCDSVSCSSPLGLTAQEALEICYISGKRNEVRLIDFSEFNPNVGNSEKTVKLMAAMAYEFLVGLTQRDTTGQQPL